MHVRVAISLLIVVTACFAGQVALDPSNVIGASGSYGVTNALGGWNWGMFNATEILDQQTGPVSDVFGSTYWINPDGGPANAFIVIDLGSPYKLSSLTLFNTHNSNYGDRGTGQFRIEAGNAVGAAAWGYGLDLTGVTSILLSDTLNAVPVSDPITGQTFQVVAAGYYRYLKLEPLTTASWYGDCCGANVYGLSEFRAFGDPMPEPASIALSACGVALLAMLRRKRA